MPLIARTFARLEVFPSYFVNRIQELLAGFIEGVVVTKLNATTVQVVAAVDDDAAGMVIDGRWRWRTTTVTRAHPGGAAGTYRIWAVAANDSIASVPQPNTDNTNYSWDLRITDNVSTPTPSAGVVDVWRLLGTLEWDGAQITSIAQTAGLAPLPAHSTSHASDGTDPLSKVLARNVLDVGQIGQSRAGRALTLADFSTLLGLPTVPAGLFNLGGLTNLGSGGNLVNKGTVPFGVGIEGLASSAAVFSGSNAQALYIVDTGAADPFRIKTGSVGCWFRTSRPITQSPLSKWVTGASGAAWMLEMASDQVIRFYISLDGTNNLHADSVSLIADDRWHFIVGTHDGSMIRIYVDGVLEGVAWGAGPIFPATAPLNIGGRGADAGTVTTNQSFGRTDEAFVTDDVMSEDQVRLLYAAKIAHGFSFAPRSAAVNVRRRKRGAPLVSADFPSQPKRLHSFTAGALTDAGSDNQTLVNNGAAPVVAGTDGSKNGAFSFLSSSSQSLSATDTGLPAGTSSRSFGCWFRSAAIVNSAIMGWGTQTTNDARLIISASGQLQSASGTDTITGPYVVDGVPHHAVVVEENTPTDGFKRRLYLDGRLVGGAITLVSLTLVGANGFRIGANPGAAAGGFFTGQVDEAFVFSGALTQEQIAVLYQKGSQALGISPKEPGAHVEAVDATNVYAILDTIESQNGVDLAVIA